MYVFSIYPANLICAVYFPTRVETAVGAHFVWIPSVVGGSLRCVGVLRDIIHTQTHVNAVCKLVHECTCAVIFALWLSSILLALRGRYSWKAARVVYAGEGLAFLVCTATLHVFGSTVYAPGNMSLGAAVGRGFLALVLAALLAPAIRLHAAELATRHGVIRPVTVSLNDI